MSADPQKLPTRALVDTSVLSYAFGQPRTVNAAVKAATEAFFEAMQKPGHTILIAAPSLAEMLRADMKFKPPRTHEIEIVDFDAVAAQTLAQQLPKSVLQDAKAALSGVTAGYIKFDAQIVACAIRHRAECIVTIDPGQARLACDAGIRAKVPADFLMAQVELPLPALHVVPVPDRG